MRGTSIAKATRDEGCRTTIATSGPGMGSDAGTQRQAMRRCNAGDRRTAPLVDAGQMGPEVGRDAVQGELWASPPSRMWTCCSGDGDADAGEHRVDHHRREIASAACATFAQSEQDLARARPQR